MLLSPEFRRQAAAVCRTSTAQQLIPALQHLQQTRLSSSRTPQLPILEQHDCRSDTSSQQIDYRGVRKLGDSWQVYVNIPKHMQPSYDDRTMYWKSGFCHPEAAARVADIMQLVYHGEAAHKRLNFPHTDYSDQQVAELRAELLAKPVTPSMRVRPRTNDPSGFKAAIAAAAEHVSGLHDGSRELVGCCQHSNGKMMVTVRAKGMKRYYIYVRTRVEAACAYDLLRMAVHGPTHAVNFPPDFYDSSWVEAAARDIELVRPGMLKAAQLVPPPPDYYCLEAGKAADAAVAAEAAAAGTAGVKVNSKVKGCSANEGGATVRALTCMKLTEIDGVCRCRREYSADIALLAPCAVDLMHLASGKPAVNLPSHQYNDSSIAAMRAWMQLEASRLAAWAAKKKQIERPQQ